MGDADLVARRIQPLLDQLIAVDSPTGCANHPADRDRGSSAGLGNQSGRPASVDWLIRFGTANTTPIKTTSQMVTDFQGEKIEHDVSFYGDAPPAAAAGAYHYQIRRDYVYFLAVGLWFVFLDGRRPVDFAAGLAAAALGFRLCVLVGGRLPPLTRTSAIMLRIETTLLPPPQIDFELVFRRLTRVTLPTRPPPVTTVSPPADRRDHLLTALHLLTLRPDEKEVHDHERSARMAEG